MTSYRHRIIEVLVTRRLRTHGAVALVGPKAVGKSTTARSFAASEVRLDQDRAALTAARTDPRLVLEGAHPRLIDECGAPHYSTHVQTWVMWSERPEAV